MRLRHVFSAAILWIMIITMAAAESLPSSKTRQWLIKNGDFALVKLMDNVSPADGSPGAVIASKSRSNPDYYYHWVRDAALAADSLIDTYQTMTDPVVRQWIRKRIFEYLDFSTRIQHVHTQTDLGEPKFYVDGSPFDEPWGRPQNDGPALRAISLIHWARVLMADGEADIVRDKMYDVRLPAELPVKKDLEYVSHHWKDPTFDLWEEVKGTHFYTLMVSRRALLEGAALAHELGDEGAANWYRMQGKEIEIELQHFWDPKRGYLTATINRVGGLDYKDSNLDCAVVLGLLHGDMHDGFFSWDDPKVLATLNKLVQTFGAIYPINHRPEITGIAIGRYPEDKYDGGNFAGGNPWPLCTLAVAEAYYRYAMLLDSRGSNIKAKEMADYADLFVERVRYHANSDGSLSEQMNKYTGYMMSADDLTWNYAALLTARKTLLMSLMGN